MPPPSGGVSIHLHRLLHKSKENNEFSLAVFDLRRCKLFMSHQTINGFAVIPFFLSCRIVHVHLSHPVKLFFARLSKLFRKKLVFTLHNNRELSNRSVKKMIELSDRVIIVSKPESLPGNGIVIPAYIHSNDITPLPESLSSKINGYEKVIVSFCSLKKISGEDLYGFDLILDAILYTERLNKSALVLVDVNGIMSAKYKSKMDEVKTKTGVDIHYYNYDLNFSKLLSSSSVFIRATRSDGDSVSVREALQLGVPVLASDCAIRPAGCIIFKSGDSFDLSKKLLEVLNTTEHATFWEEDYSGKILKLYKNLIS
jgi:glycosyltransferase involved in cell wall biosynthesis